MMSQASGNDPTYGDLKVRLAELERRAFLLEHTLNSLSDGVRIVDHDLNVIFSNRAAYRVDGTRPAGPNGKCYHYVGRAEPCERCPVVEHEMADPCCYVLEAGVSSNERSGDETPGCRLLATIAAPTPDTTPAIESHPDSAPAAPPSEHRLGSLIARSTPMRHLFEMIRLVSPSDATVLLEGESGTGKEMVARTIHALSRRRDHPFVVIDCGALPETLLESELFGHVRGAFTGAVSAKRGLFEEAEGGTIFLDEIADMSPVLQGKLLRVIQEGEIKPVGGTRRIKVDARIIAASNKAMAPLVASRAFREDLYYRLAVIPLTIPPLRDRREDIPLLLESFVAEFCGRYGRPLLAVPAAVIQLLTSHPWPGNVRELRHVIERAVLTATGPQLAADRLFMNLVGKKTGPSRMASLRDEMQEAKQLLERTRIVEALRQARGNKAKAARLLQISRANFYIKLRDYQITAAERGEQTDQLRHTDEKTV